jgi:phage shock protein PspC (stress-responsive transcriptional regulator)
LYHILVLIISHMKKVVTIHLSGKLFQIEEDAYYAMDKALIFVRNNDPKNFESVEASLAEELNSKTNSGQQVITIQMVNEVLRNKGLLNYSNSSNQNKKSYDRLYRNPDNKVLGGVCSGLADYWGIDPVLFRLLFVVLFFGFGTGFLLYIIMWIVIPKAD